MKRKNNRRKNSLFSLLILLLLSVGLGYALLSSDLGINGFATIDNATWNVHFANIVETDGSVLPDQEATIDTPTSVSFEVTLNQPGDYYDFLVDVVNEGSIDAMISGFTISYNGETDYEIPAYLEWGLTYDDYVEIEPNQLLSAGTSETYRFRVRFKTVINPGDLPNDDTDHDFILIIDYEQANPIAEPRDRMAMIGVTDENDTTAFRSSTYKTNIKTITLENELNPPANYIESWDIGNIHNGDVMAYVLENSEDNTKYDLIIQGNGHLYANPDSSWLFSGFTGVDAFHGIDNLDISLVTDMSEMFSELGYNSTVFTLDLGDHFDTSHVTNMYDMFYGTGYNSPVFTLDLGPNFDTSNVENMAWMFDRAGHESTVFTLDLGDKFDTSNVETMEGMFYYTGYKSTVFTLDLGDNFDTSNVISMRSMFNGTGVYATEFLLDLGDKFDTSNVTTMYSMFNNFGTLSTTCAIDLGDHFNTSKVEDMRFMFADIANRATSFTLNLGDNFDTHNVIRMDGMFTQSVWKAENFTLDLGDKFDTSNVTNMSYMFWSFATKSTVFTLDLGELFDTSNVTNMAYMFGSGIGAYSPYFTLDLGEHFDTSNVTNMECMFDGVAYDFSVSTNNFTLDLGDKFDTSNVTNMKRMFTFVGAANPNFTLDLGELFDSSHATNMTGTFAGIGNANPNLEIDLSSVSFQQATSYDGMFGKGGDGWGQNLPFTATQKMYVKDSSDVEWIVTHVGAEAERQNAFLTRDNVLVKP